LEHQFINNRAILAKKEKPGAFGIKNGNPAFPLGPVAFRPRLATGLAFTLFVKKAKTRYEDSSVAGFPVPLKVGEVPENQIPTILQFDCGRV